MELPKTEAELEELISKAKKDAREEAETEFNKNRNADFGKLRAELTEEKKTAVAKAIKDTREQVEAEMRATFETENKTVLDELKTLKENNKVRERGDKVDKAGLPSIFKNDVRLLNAEDDKVDEVIKTLGEEWKTLNPKGSKVDTNVINNNKGGKNEDDFSNFRGLGLRK